MEAHCPSVTVVKLGSSVLPDAEAVLRAARELDLLVRDGERIVAVVSALGDTTDRLLAEAGSRHPGAPEPALARFLATGEQHAAARLALALSALGRSVTVAEPATIRLLADRDGLDAEPAFVDPLFLRILLAEDEIVVVPGFYGARPGGRVACFGRGGSDLTALVLAEALSARCVLYKDVDGIYTDDPNAPLSRAVRYERVSYRTAIRAGGGVVQEKTLRIARRLRRRFEVTALGSEVRTIVGAPDRLAESKRLRPIARRSLDSLRAVKPRSTRSEGTGRGGSVESHAEVRA